MTSPDKKNTVQFQWWCSLPSSVNIIIFVLNAVSSARYNTIKVDANALAMCQTLSPESQKGRWLHCRFNAWHPTSGLTFSRPRSVRAMV